MAEIIYWSKVVDCPIFFCALKSNAFSKSNAFFLDDFWGWQYERKFLMPRQKKAPGEKRVTASVRLLPALNQAWKEIARTEATSKGRILESYIEADQRVRRGGEGKR